VFTIKMGVRGFLLFLIVAAVLAGAAYYAYTQGMFADYLPLADGWTRCVGTCTIPSNQEMRLYSTDLTRKFQVAQTWHRHRVVGEFQVRQDIVWHAGHQVRLLPDRHQDGPVSARRCACLRF
jgi:hypothetical protein